MHQHTLSLSGGNNKNNYRVSIDYRKAEGVDLYSSREEYGGRAGIQQTTRNGLFTFTANVAPRLIKRKTHLGMYFAIRWRLIPRLLLWM